MFLACLRHNLFSLKTVYCSLLRSVDIYYAVKTFLEYAEDVAHLIEGLQYHLFADDMQGQKHGRPADVPAIISALEDCATEYGRQRLVRSETSSA